VLPYADITVWAYHRILKEFPGRPLITSACAGMNRYLKRKHPEYAEYLAPVYSPLLCTARYLRNYRGLTEPFAFLSPCLLKYHEFSPGDDGALIQYNITIKELFAWLKEKNIDTGGQQPCFPEQDRCGQGLTVAAYGGIGKALEALSPGLRYTVAQGPQSIPACFAPPSTPLAPAAAIRTPCAFPLVFEAYACEGGCSNGSGVRGIPGMPRPGKESESRKTAGGGDINAILDLFSYYDQRLRMADFCYI
jgi:iron only hydrogenase large subunit-like protein